MDDHQLLQEYVATRSEKAFAELLARHVDLVYATALRMVREPHMAKDVTQTVFIQLAQKASSVREGNALPGWLYRATYGTGVSMIRSESRRREREAEALQLAAEPTTPAAWPAIAALLDEAMQELKPDEQDAVILRYFEGKSLREVGEKQRLSDDAAQKRVSRAVDKLRGYFARHGVVATVALLGTLLTAHAVQAAPVDLTAQITGAAYAKSIGVEMGRGANVIKTASRGKILTSVSTVVVLSIIVAWSALRQGVVEQPIPAKPASVLHAGNLVVAQIPASPIPPPAPLSNNLTLTLQGQYGSEDSIDLTWSGPGPDFNLESTPDKTAEQIKFSGGFSPEGDGYRVEFTLNGSVTVVTSATSLPNGTQTTSNKPVSLQSSVILKPGHPATILDSNGKVLVLTLDKAR